MSRVVFIDVEDGTFEKAILLGAKTVLLPSASAVSKAIPSVVLAMADATETSEVRLAALDVSVQEKRVVADSRERAQDTLEVGRILCEREGREESEYGEREGAHHEDLLMLGSKQGRVAKLSMDEVDVTSLVYG